MHVDFMDSLMKLIIHLNREGIRHEYRKSNATLVYIARNRMACDAINDGFSHVLWIDSDMVFPETVLEDLAFHGKDFVTAACCSRRPPFGLCQYKCLNPVEHVQELGMELQQIAGCGFAMALTSVEMLKDVQTKYGNCFTPMPKFGEDLAFCVRATELGYKIFLDPTVRIGHIAHHAIWPGDSET